MGTSPLMMASMKGHYSLAICLIENGADWLAQNKVSILTEFIVVYNQISSQYCNSSNRGLHQLGSPM